MARAPGTRLVFPTPEGGQWNRARFRDRVWLKSVAAAAKNDKEESERDVSVFDGFTFHWLRHTAGSLMAVAGLDPAVASERMGHTDGGALFLQDIPPSVRGREARPGAAVGGACPRELGQGRDIDPWESRTSA